jgi:hypothetical protein
MASTSPAAVKAGRMTWCVSAARRLRWPERGFTQKPAAVTPRVKPFYPYQSKRRLSEPPWVGMLSSSDAHQRLMREQKIFIDGCRGQK